LVVAASLAKRQQFGTKAWAKKTAQAALKNRLVPVVPKDKVFMFI
jgi:hypothetical protein